jgi:hypothetical protein
VKELSVGDSHGKLVIEEMRLFQFHYQDTTSDRACVSVNCKLCKSAIALYRL